MAEDILKRNWLHHSDMELFGGLLQFVLRCFSVREYRLWANFSQVLRQKQFAPKTTRQQKPKYSVTSFQIKQLFKISMLGKAEIQALDFKSSPKEKHLRSMRGILELLTALNSQTLVSVVWNIQRLFSCVNTKNYTSSWKE